MVYSPETGAILFASNFCHRLFGSIMRLKTNMAESDVDDEFIIIARNASAIITSDIATKNKLNNNNNQ